LIDVEQALEAFEGQFNLPAQSVDIENFGGRDMILVERGDEDDELGRDQASRVDLPVV
jgi:hypothetical protein